MKKMIVILAALLATTGLQAQETFQKAYQEVMNRPAVKLLSRTDYVDTPDSPTTYCKFTEFEIPAHDESLVKQLEQAILSEQSKAYSFYIKTPKGGKLGYVRRYTYGVNNEYSVLLGAQKSHYYYGACFQEPTDSLRRHAYLFVWFKEGKSFHCYYYHIYGKNPNLSKSLQKSDRTVEKGLSRRRATLSGNSLIVEQYDDKGQLTLRQHQLVGDSQKVTNDIEFITQFGLLRVAFLDAIKDADQKMLQVGIAAKMVALCKDHGNLLTPVERQTCNKTLSDLRTTVEQTLPDTYLDGMLQQAAAYLGTK